MSPLFRLREWPAYVRVFALSFLLVATAGYTIGLFFVGQTTSMSPSGIRDQYVGNEQEMKFGKSQGEMLTIVHTHLLGIGVLLFAVGLLFAGTDWSPRRKGIVMAESMISLLLTFLCIWSIAQGHKHWLWLLYPASAATAIAFYLMVVISGWHMLTPHRSPLTEQTPL